MEGKIWLLQESKSNWEYKTMKVFMSWSGLVISPLPWSACFDVWPLLHWIFFSDIHPEPPLVQLEAFSPCPVTNCVGEEAKPCLWLEYPTAFSKSDVPVQSAMRCFPQKLQLNRNDWVFWDHLTPTVEWCWFSTSKYQWRVGELLRMVQNSSEYFRSQEGDEIKRK